MAKKKKQRKISKTEKTLRNKLSYRNRKVKKLYSEMNFQVDKLESLKPLGVKKINGKKVVTYRATDEIKKILGREGQKNVIVHKQTIVDAYFSKIYKIRNETDLIEQTIEKRFKKPRLLKKQILRVGKKETRITLGFVWQVDREINPQLIKNIAVNSVEGFSKRKDLDLIIDKINDAKLKMSSNDFLILVGVPKGDFKINVVNKDYNDAEKKE